MIIDENYPGIMLGKVTDSEIIFNKDFKKGDEIFRLEYLPSKGDVEIKVPLIVLRDIIIGGSLKSESYIMSSGTGRIIVDKTINVKGGIYSSSGIKAGESIFSDKDIVAVSSINAKETIQAEGEISTCVSIKAKNIRAGRLVDIGNTLECDNLKVIGHLSVDANIKVKNSFDVGTISQICGVKTDICINIASKYKIIVLSNHIIIDKQMYSRKEWKNFTAKDLIKMNDYFDSLWFLENKKWILKIRL